MYLTRFDFNTARRHAKKLLGSPQVMHSAVMHSFPPSTLGPAPEGRVLWRLDRDDHRTQLFIASPVPPDLTHLIEQAGWPTTSTWQTRDYRPMLDRLTTGQRWAFRVAANPTHSVRTNDAQTTTKPTAHVTVAHQENWLLGRAADRGFRVVEDTSGRPRMTVKDRTLLRFGRQGKTVTVSRAVFDGELEIVNADLLRQVLVNGLGRAKAYGCGLLTLAPIA